MAHVTNRLYHLKNYKLCHYSGLTRSRTNDGRWTLIWNGENRLVTLVRNVSVLSIDT
jgi:hypothetical protein